MDKLICFGKNYLSHALEMGDTTSENPVLFLKPPSVVVKVQSMRDLVQVELPVGRGEVHHECEIILQLDSKGLIHSVSLGLDLTLRDEQAQLRKKGQPWEISKVFKNSAVIGPWVPVSSFEKFLEEEFAFSLDGQVRQRGYGKEMRFSAEKCAIYAKKFFPLCDGDVIFTGTPAGVGPVSSGQIAELNWGKSFNYRVSFK